MKEYLELGATPCNEDCAQVGSDNYFEESSKESKRYIDLLEKKFGEHRPLSCSFRKKSFPHDFGSYYEVVVYFDSNDDESVKFAYHVENNLPETWSDDKKVPFITGA